jgi:hypothetical protein
MLREVLTIRSDQSANVLALVSKSFQKGPRHRVEVTEIDQRLGELRARGMGGQEIPAVDLSSADVVTDELLL